MEIYLNLIFNISLLVALSIVSGFLEKYWPRHTRSGVLLQGILFGAAAVIGMMEAIKVESGIIFDGRSVMISLCALFYGPWAGSVASVMVILGRIGLGGSGILTGVLVILSSLAIGLVGHFRLKPFVAPPTIQRLYAFGIAVHVAMLILLFTLPETFRLKTLLHIGLPIILLYPLATILIGKILSDQVTAAQTMADLQHTREKLAITLQSIGDAVISTNLKGEIVFMNPVAEALTGWPEGEARGKPLAEVFQIVNEETRAKMENPVSRVLREGKVVGLANHTLLISRDGVDRPIADSAAPIRDQKGVVSGVVMVFRDQSSERQLQRTLQTRLTLLEYATSHTLDELLVKALDEISTLVDSPIAYYHLVDSDRMTVTLQQWSTRIAEFCDLKGEGMHYGIDQAGVWVDCFHQKKPVVHNDYPSLPHRKGLPEGHVELIRDLAVPIIREGKVVAILGMGNKPTDYTERDIDLVAYLADETWQIVDKKRTEGMLLESEALFRNLFENHAAAKLLIDPDSGHILDVNEAAASFYGWPRERLRQMSIQDINTLSPEEVKQEMEKAWALSRVYFEFKHRLADGSVRDVAVFSSKIEVKGKELLHSIIHDITQRKQAEEALRESEQHFRNLADSGQALVWTSGLDKKCNYFNKVWLEFTGRSPGPKRAWEKHSNPCSLHSNAVNCCLAATVQGSRRMLY